MSKETQQGQSFFDKAITMSGSYQDIVALAVFNGVSITDELEKGFVLNPIKTINQRVVNALNKRSAPATALQTEDKQQVSVEYGIGSMIIESTFKIY